MTHPAVSYPNRVPGVIASTYLFLASKYPFETIMERSFATKNVTTVRLEMELISRV